ncbi:MAG TPA: sigma-70 family RNA polymerase sigma factor [Tepidiformaceae bacterium]|nr:sigma-70 family RNA polymerase sigma factor [Tepidiformaceae bacterium]
MDQLSDRALVELARAGDQQAFAELYARWFDPVYDFVARMMRNRDEAADVAQDTFLKAMNALGGLQKDASFKSWIFTIARNTALNRIQKSGRTRPLAYEGDDGEEISLDVVDTDRLGSPEEAAEVKAVASLVWEAAAGLDPRQLSLLDLHLRQGLDSAEIADVLGVTKNNGYVMLNRLKKAVEDAIGAFIMFKDGRRYCDDLDSLLSAANVAGMSPDTRKLVERHVAACPECEERKKKLAPLAALGAFAAVGVPPHVKAHVLDELMREWPGPAAAGSSGGDLPPPSDGGFGPLPGDDGELDKPTFGEKFMAHGARLVVGAGIAALLMLGAVLVPASPFSPFGDEKSSAQQSDGDGSPSAVANTATPTPTRTARPSQAGVTPSATPTTTPTPPIATLPAGAPSNTPAPTETPGPGIPTPTEAPATLTPTPTATATATPTRTPIPCTPSVSTNVGSLNVAPGQDSSFLLLVSCDTSEFSVVGGDGWASAAPASGSVSFASPRTIVVSVDPSTLSEGVHSTTLQVFGDYNTAGVTVTTTVGGAAPQVSITRVSCSATAPTFVVAAAITDDYAVKSAVVRLSTGSGVSEYPLDGPDGSASGTWGVNVSGVSGITSWEVIATDYGGHAGAATGSC